MSSRQVLHFLAGLKPAEVAFQLFPVLLHAAILRIETTGERRGLSFVASHQYFKISLQNHSESLKKDESINFSLDTSHYW